MSFLFLTGLDSHKHLREQQQGQLRQQEEQLGQQQEQQQGEARMFSLHRGVWTVPSPDVFLRYNFSDDPVRQFTVCYRIRYNAPFLACPF